MNKLRKTESLINRGELSAVSSRKKTSRLQQSGRQSGDLGNSMKDERVKSYVDFDGKWWPFARELFAEWPLILLLLWV